MNKFKQAKIHQGLYDYLSQSLMHLSSNSYNNSSMASTIIMSTHSPSFSLIQNVWRLPWYTQNKPSTMVQKN